MTQAQRRTYMCNYIKHMGSHTLQQLKKLSFDEIKELFEITMKRVNTFTPMESDDIVSKVVVGSSKRDAEQELNRKPNKLDMSYSGLEEFQQPEFEGYGLRANKSVCENSSNETKKNSDAPLIEEWVSDNEDKVESPVVVKKKIVFPTAAKIEFVRPKQHEKPVKPSNHVGSGCQRTEIDQFPKYNNASITLKRIDYIDAQGRFKSVMAWVPIRKIFGVNLLNR
ncbi:hypothetical protein Tco_0133515 [Tanacetum coccineum]